DSVGSGHVEAPFQQVRRDGQRVVRVGGRLVLAGALGTQTGLAHQTSDTLATDPNAHLRELLMHAWRSVAAPGTSKDLPNEPEELLVSALASRLLLPFPFVRRWARPRARRTSPERRRRPSPRR